MPTASQYILDPKELVEAIIKQTDVHEGKWVLMVMFGFGAANAGASENEVLPTGIVSVQKIGIQLAGADSPAGLVVDAAEVNPTPRPAKHTKA
jgi:hypothetical protein